MRICIVNPFFDDAPETFLEVTGRYRHVEALAAALARRGHRVGVVQAFHEDKTEERNSVTFMYAKAPYRSAQRLSGGPIGIDLLFQSNLKRLIEMLNAFDPDAVHMNGVTLLQPLAAIGRWCEKRKRTLTVSYHGGLPRRASWLQPIQRAILRRCQGALFTTPEHASPWISAGLVRAQQVISCMEVSSTFVTTDRASARGRTGMSGSPVFVWNAGLLPDKDPITALRGFGLIRRSWQEARLYMIYVNDQMLAEVEQVIAKDPDLQGAVELRDRIPHDRVEDFFNSADFIIQTSHREAASYSVLEAMSCSVIPVVTDIPSFRCMTNGGHCGVLFPIGGYETMAEKVLRITAPAAASLAADALRFFTESLSYDAVAATYETALSCTRFHAI